MVSTEETVAGDQDRCSEFFTDGKLLAVSPSTHKSLNYFLTLLSSPGTERLYSRGFPEELDRRGFTEELL